MAQWETCKIESKSLRDFKIKSGFFNDTYVPGIRQWEATRTGSSGSEIIYKSEECQWGLGAKKSDDEKNEREYQKMISHLLNEGWEPAATNEYGGITLMKRQITESEPQAATAPVNLLKQLANLHEAGILTDQEFEAKKAELLKRM